MQELIEKLKDLYYYDLKEGIRNGAILVDIELSQELLEKEKKFMADVWLDAQVAHQGDGYIKPSDPTFDEYYEKTFNTKREMKEYRKIATVKAKLFEKGDEDGMIHKDGILGVMQDAKYGLKPDLVPYISTLKNQHHRGEFGKHYLCVGIKGEKWLVEKEIFESTYEAI